MGATPGDTACQTLWEFFTLLLACELWAPRLSEWVFRVKGDNLGALQSALRMSGRGMMNHVARECTWRKAIRRPCGRSLALERPAGLREGVPE